MEPDLRRRVEELDRRWAVRGVVALLVVVALVSAVGATLAYDPPEIEPGTVTEPTNGATIVSVQGFHYQGEDWEKKPARLLSFNETANLDWKYNGSRTRANWFYDADPLPNGNVLVVNTFRSRNGEPLTAVYELDPETRQRVWQRTFVMEDTHDADLINNGSQLLIGHMRAGVNDAVRLYDFGGDRSNFQNDEGFVWSWLFYDHYPQSTDGGIPSGDDWTHLNDVDKIDDGKYMVSPRNFDQVIVVDRETKNITLRLGEDVLPGEDPTGSTLHEQHNPTYLETEDGKPVILVADSEHDRVVEYTCFNRSGATCDWELTWEIGAGGNLDWPRDANRLPNGNTLITDSLNHRVIEVTPEGEVVWEAYAPWAPFSAERAAAGNDGVRSPTMHDLDRGGSYEVTGSAAAVPGTGDGQTFPQWLRSTFGGLPLVGGLLTDLADAWDAGVAWIKPTWMAPWSIAYLSVGLLIVIGWGLAEGIYQRRRIADGVRTVVRRARARME